MKFSNVALCGLLGTLILPIATNSARAQQIVQDRTEASGPNRAMLHSGIWTLGLSYVPAVVVAAESGRHGDKNLYIPVAGPWMDLSARGSCPPNTTCSNETTNKVLLAVDGVFQGIGALDIVGAFLFPETRTITAASRDKTQLHVGGLSLRFTPARLQSGYGVSALGSF